MGVVAKLGGYCMGTPKRFSHASRINADILVYSAPQSVTDKLEALASGTGSIEEVLQPFKKIHSKLGLPHSLYTSLSKELKKRVDKPRKKWYRDQLVALGDEYSARWNAHYLDIEFVDANDMFVIRGDYGCGLVEYDLTKSRIVSRMQPGYRYGTQGFSGRNKNGRIITGPRGSTDTWAAVITAALDFHRMEAYKDQPGIRCAPPEFVKDARVIDTITYTELENLGDYGFKIMNPHALMPLQKSEIVLQVRDYDNLKGPGTSVLCRRVYEEAGRAVGVTGKNGFVAIVMKRPYMRDDPTVMQGVETLLHDHSIRPVIRQVLGHSYRIVIPEEQMRGVVAHNFGRDLFRQYNITCSQLERRAIVAVVGHGLVDAQGSLARAAKVLAKKHVNIEEMSQAEEFLMPFSIRPTDLHTAVGALYKTFCYTP